METKEGDRAYIVVKKSLDALGYKEYLGAESAPLVNSLVKDLIKATKAFKNIQSEKNSLEAELKCQKDVMLPLRNENLKLSRENNLLHKNLIQAQDDLDMRNNANDLSKKKVQSALEEMEFNLEQKDLKLKKLDRENEQLRTKLNIIYKKLFMGAADKSVINSKGLPNIAKLTNTMTPPEMNSEFKKPLIEMFEKLSSDDMNMSGTNNMMNTNDMASSNNNMINTNNINNINNNIASTFQQDALKNDLIKADEENQKLRNDIKSLKDSLNKKDNNIEKLNSCIYRRDIEIKRLQDNAFLGDDNMKEIKEKYKSEFITLQNEKLLAQLEFLNNENHNLRRIDYFHTHRCRMEEIKRLDEQIENLQKENQKLKKTLEKNNIHNTNTSIMSGSTSVFRQGNKSRNNEIISRLKNEKSDLSKLLEEEKSKNMDLSSSKIVIENSLKKFKKENASLLKKIEELQKEPSKNKNKIDVKSESRNDKNKDKDKGDNKTESKALTKMDTEESKYLKSEGNIIASKIKEKGEEDKKDKVNKSAELDENLKTELLDKITHLETENNELKEKLEKNQKEYMDQLTLNEKSNKNYENQIESINKLKEELNQENDKLKIENENLKGQLLGNINLKDNVNELENKVKDLSIENSNLDAQIKALEKENDNINNDLDEKIEKSVNLEVENQRLKDLSFKLKQKVNILQNELNKSKLQLSESSKSLSIANQKIINLENEISKKNTTISEKDKTIEKMSLEINKLKGINNLNLDINKEGDLLNRGSVDKKQEDGDDFIINPKGTLSSIDNYNREIANLNKGISGANALKKYSVESESGRSGKFLKSNEKSLRDKTGSNLEEEFKNLQNNLSSRDKPGDDNTLEFSARDIINK